MLIFLGMPVGFAFATVGFVGLLITKGLTTALFTLGNTPLTWASSESLMPMPLFILMGFFAYNSGISEDLYKMASKWVGRFPGGLAHATTLACTGFAACCGSSVASAATMGAIAYPEMEKYRYDRRLSTGTIGAGGLLGPLIPPSMTFIVLGVLTQTSIAKLFIAGIFPGLLQASLFLITIWGWCRINPQLGPAGPSYSWREMLLSLKGVWGMLALFLLVIGGLYAGIFTPSEAGAIGAFGAFFICLIRKRMSYKNLISSLKSSASVACYVFTIFIGAMVFNILLGVSGVSNLLSNWIISFDVSPWIILICTMLIYLPLGAVMDPLPISLLTIPIFFPIITGFGFDPIWYLVLVSIAGEQALLTPPIGMNVFVVHGVTRVSLWTVYRGVAPFGFMVVLSIAIMMVFPQIVLYLPHIMR